MISIFLTLRILEVEGRAPLHWQDLASTVSNDRSECWVGRLFPAISSEGLGVTA
jgi:hypothetical protein